MKNNLLTILALVFVAMTTSAQVKTPSVGADAEPAITRLREGLVDSFNHQDIDRLLTSFRLADQSRQGAERIRAYHHIDQLLFFQEFVFQPFGHATQDTNKHTRPVSLHLPEQVETVPDGLFRLFPDAAGIEEYEVRLFIVSGRAKAIIIKNGCYDLAVREVHRATVTFDIEFLPLVPAINGQRGKGFTLPCFIMCLCPQ